VEIADLPEEPAVLPPRDSTFVQSLDRGLAVIRAFDAEHPRLGLSEVARATGLTRAAARRFLLTLVQLGYVRMEGREFSLRPRVLELGYSYLSGLTLPEVAEPHLETLVSEVHESSSVSVLDGDDIVYVARVPTKRIMTVLIAVGTRFPAHPTSMGRVLLAGLPQAELAGYLQRAEFVRYTDRTITDPVELRAEVEQVRRQGYAVVDEELEAGLRSAAAPIHGADGEVVAALNVSVHASRTSMQQLEHELVPALLQTARHIEHDLLRTRRPGS
jgi:IclR family transcriptional regulator, pca regulon regulatory protein